MKKAVFILFIFTLMEASFACEPKAFDFSVFMKVNDVNGDGYLNLYELKNADMNRDYGNTLTKQLNTVEVFNELDKNGDKQLSKEELWQWGAHNFNGCAGFPELD